MFLIWMSFSKQSSGRIFVHRFFQYEIVVFSIPSFEVLAHFSLYQLLQLTASGPLNLEPSIVSSNLKAPVGLKIEHAFSSSKKN